MRTTVERSVSPTVPDADQELKDEAFYLAALKGMPTWANDEERLERGKQALENHFKRYAEQGVRLDLAQLLGGGGA